LKLKKNTHPEKITLLMRHEYRNGMSGGRASSRWKVRLEKMMSETECIAGLFRLIRHVVPFFFGAALLITSDRVRSCSAQEVNPEPGSDLQASSKTIANESSPSEKEVQQLIADLGSDDFATRQQAAEKLQHIGPAQISLVAQEALRSEDGEVVSRLMKLLERFYIDRNSNLVNAASEMLEESRESPRWMVSEAAAATLTEHWEVRFQLVRQELRSLGVSFSDPSSALTEPGRMIFSEEPVPRVHLDRNWRGGERGIVLLQRLAEMTGGSHQAGRIPLGIYVLDGNPLTRDQLTLLKRAYGDRLIERGRVCLGIANDSLFPDERGCRVGIVTRGTSAADAGIRSGDIILAVDDTPIKDFQNLVEVLRKYNVGNTVRMKIKRGDPGGDQLRANLFRRQLPEPNPDETGRSEVIEISVVLKGWD
jgi:hypothetical protein